MNDERIYVIVPQTVQSEITSESAHWDDMRPDDEPIETQIQNNKMVAGRLIAQGVHVGRLLERIFANSGISYREITTITLSVRNSKELTKVSAEIKAALLKNDPHGMNVRYTYGEFHDTTLNFTELNRKFTQ
jgi:hypothetical protein